MMGGSHHVARPTLLVAEPEPEQALSARKLLLETFKFNVITAHSIKEAVEVVHLFPNVDALVLHCGIRNFDSGNLIEVVKKTLPKLPIIALTPTRARVSLGRSRRAQSRSAGTVGPGAAVIWRSAKKSAAGGQLRSL